MFSLPLRCFAVTRATAAVLVLSGLTGLIVASGAAQAQQAGGDSTAQRLSQLEEQIVDLQVAIGTLQSLVTRGSSANAGDPGGPAPNQGAAAASQGGFGNGGGDSDLAFRVDAIETQISALTGQIEQLSQQITELQAQPGGGQPFDAGSAPPFGSPDGSSDPYGAGGTTPWQTESTASPQGVSPPNQGQSPEQGPAQYPPQPQLQFDTQPQQSPGGGSGDQLAALTGGDSKQVYEEAYGHLVRRNYDAAEEGFQRFIQAFPSDALAGNAQYWLGETYYVRGQYKEAADAFLDSYRKYNNSSKAPDSLLKLGMSLNQLGQGQSACDTYSELTSKFPNAPDHVKQRTSAERSRAGC